MNYFPGTYCFSCNVSHIAAYAASKSEAKRGKSEERNLHVRSLSASPPIQKHLTSTYVHVCLHHGWQKLTPVCSPLFHPSREEEFDEYFEDMFLWLPASAACHPAVTTLASLLTLSAFPSQCACKMVPPVFPPLRFVLSLAVFKCHRNKPKVYPVTSLFWFCSLSVASSATVYNTGEYVQSGRWWTMADTLPRSWSGF